MGNTLETQPDEGQVDPHTSQQQQDNKASTGGPIARVNSDSTRVSVSTQSHGTSVASSRSRQPSRLPKEHRLRSFQRYAHCAEDIEVLATFLQVCKVTSSMQTDEYLVKLLLKMLKFLHLCDYPMEDILSILVHASSYFNDAYAACFSAMDSVEMANVLTVFVFLAHCIVEDEACPLRVWHKHLFSKYCSLQTLNSAVVQLMEHRNYKLRVHEDVFFSTLQSFQHVAPWLRRPAATST